MRNSRIKGGNASNRPSVITAVGRFFYFIYLGGFAYAEKGTYFRVVEFYCTGNGVSGLWE
ncbi:hypothetical protein LPE01_29260 [Lactiplantibacillus pentosus]|nr:hypothetical protein LPE01_29260 [Lactiplantibacillus pentosus]